MNLFHNHHLTSNLLPFDGEVFYFGLVIPLNESKKYFNHLFNQIPWQQDEVRIAGRTFITKRKVAWYADRKFTYEYSGTSKTALLWTDELLALKLLAEKKCDASYNACLLNLYHNGEEGVNWHSDNERSIQNTSSIASISFGAERRFDFKHKSTKEKISVILENGSLLEMKGNTHKFWQHSLPKTKKVKAARINLTFRKMVEG